MYWAARRVKERRSLPFAYATEARARRGDLAAMPQREEVDVLINPIAREPVVLATHHG
jgi:hypothetical protein